MSDGSLISGFLSVNRAGEADDAPTWLIYQVAHVTFEPDWSSSYSTVAGGSGYIPSIDLTSEGRAIVRLQIDTSAEANPAFNRATPGGPITVEWRKTEGFSSLITGVVRRDFGTRSFTQTGTMSTSAASVQGSLLGVPIGSNSQGTIGHNRNVTLTIQRWP